MNAKCATPSMSDGNINYRRKHLSHRRFNQRVNLRIVIEIRSDTTSELIRSTSSSECDTAICSSLHVNDQVAPIRHGLSVGPADFAPLRLCQWLRCNHVRVQRCNISAELTHSGCETLRCSDYPLGFDGRVSFGCFCRHTMRGDLHDTSRAKESNISGKQLMNKAINQLCGLQRCTVGAIRSPVRAANAHAIFSLVR